MDFEKLLEELGRNIIKSRRERLEMSEKKRREEQERIM
jgi:hypothetical protein